MRHIAIIGSGPAGYYTAEAAQKKFGDDVMIDIIDRLPVPYGLIRFGVAPDHQSIKAVSRRYEAVNLTKNVCVVGTVVKGGEISLGNSPHGCTVTMHSIFLLLLGFTLCRTDGCYIWGTDSGICTSDSLREDWRAQNMPFCGKNAIQFPVCVPQYQVITTEPEIGVIHSRWSTSSHRLCPVLFKVNLYSCRLLLHYQNNL